MKKTAMQDLRSSLAYLNHEVNNTAYELINTIIKGIDTVYLEMERQQIIDFAHKYEEYCNYSLNQNRYIQIKSAEQYYNETYGGDK